MIHAENVVEPIKVPRNHLKENFPINSLHNYDISHVQFPPPPQKKKNCLWPIETSDTVALTCRTMWLVVAPCRLKITHRHSHVNVKTKNCFFFLNVTDIRLESPTGECKTNKTCRRETWAPSFDATVTQVERDDEGRAKNSPKTGFGSVKDKRKIYIPVILGIHIFYFRITNRAVFSTRRNKAPFMSYRLSAGSPTW